MPALPRAALALLIGGALLAGRGCGAGEAEKLAVRDAWVRSVPASQSVTTAYMVIENPTERRVVLTAAESPIAEVVEIHKMAHDSGMMRMRRIESLEILAYGRVTLAPGGLHLMLIGLRQRPEEGKEVPILLRFEDAGSEASTVQVRAVVAGAAGPAQH